MKKGFIFLLLAAAAVLPSLASPIYEGSDTACFIPLLGSTCTLTGAPSGIGVNLLGNPLLIYTPDTTDFTAPDTGGPVQLGTFYVTPSLLGLTDSTFDLDVKFSLPGTGDNSYSAKAVGLVIIGLYGAEVTFQAPLTELYTTSGGSFDLSLPSSPLLIGSGQTIALDAIITPITSAPEPDTLPVVAGGFLVLGLLVYGRRNAKLANS